MSTKQWQHPTIENINWNLPEAPLPLELLQILHKRGIKNVEEAKAFIYPEYYHPSLPSALPNLEYGVALLKELLTKPNAKILIWGDFDVDGQTATSILWEGLTKLGFNVDCYIPDRVKESHGVHLKSLKPLLEEKHPDLLLVCDTGSSDVEAIAYAKSLGIWVIIADHHELSEVLPPADVLINPLLLNDVSHPLYTLSGVGVSYLLIYSLFESLGRSGDVRNFLELVAIGLVADVVDLVKDTRYLVQLGLRMLRRTDRLGMLALCQLLQVNPVRLAEGDVGFRIAPSLNALGRLGSALDGVFLLTTRNAVTAQMLAEKAIGLNLQRRNLTSQIEASAKEQIENDPSLLNWEALVLSSPNWHNGIVGIVAARLAETYQKPVALLVTDLEGNARGSIRSIKGYHVSNALAQLADILLSYGGHEGAGGLAINAENFPLLRRRLSQAFATTAQSVEVDILPIDAILSLEQLSLDFAYQLQRLAPFGPGNPAPIFMTQDLSLASVAKLGDKDQHRRLTIQNRDGQRKTVLWWNSIDKPMPAGRFDIAYKLEISTYQDTPEIQIVLEDWRQVAPPLLNPIETAHILDYRDKHPTEALKQIQETSLAVWAEGFPSAKSPGLPLSQLTPAESLVILTAPASHKDLLKAITTVQPQRIYLIAAPSPIADLATYLQTLTGLMHSILEKQKGETSLTELSERLAVTNQIVQIGLEYLAPQDRLSVTIGGRGKVKIEVGQSQSTATLEKLTSLWNELEAYRRYVQRVSIEDLLN